MAEEKGSTLQTCLDRVLRQWRMTATLQGLAFMVTAAVLLAGFSLFLDYAVGLGSLARGGLLLLCIAGVAGVAVRYLFRPLRRVPTDLQVARYIEEQHPELNDGFVSAVEFDGRPLDGAARIFLDRLMTQVRAQSNQIDFTRVIDRRRLHRSEGAAFVAIVLLALFAMQDVELFGRSATRLIAPWAHSGAVPAMELKVTPGDVRVRRGGAQLVTARITGRLPSSVRLAVKSEGRKDWQPVDMSGTEETGRFTYELSGIEQDTDYYVEAGPARSSKYAITVYDAPRVERIDLSYRYPVYTGLAPKTEEDAGDVTAPVGTVVALAITANKPIVSARLAFSNDKTGTLKVDGKTLTGRLTVREDLSYTVRLTDMDGLPNEEPVEYYIRAVADQPPRVAITDPGRDTRVSPVDEVMIRAEAEDDFGLSSFSLTYSVNGGPDQTIDLSGAGEKKNDAGGILWEGRHTFYLEELSLKPGDFLTYYAEAGDRRSDAAKSATDMYFLDIKPFEETFRQGTGGGGGGVGGMGGLSPERLSREEKEIIAATWRVERDQPRVEEKQTRNDLNAIAETQEGLKARVGEAADAVRWQGGADKETQRIADLLQQAIEPMEQAAGRLRAGAAKEALPVEREALRHLLKVDALAREYMVTRSNNNMAQSSAPLDRSDTSELELKRDENKYETLDRSDRNQQQSRTVDESSRRVKELARRQEQLNRRMRQQANAERQSSAERRRELDRLTREQRQLRQQAEELARRLSGMPASSSPREMRQSVGEAADGLRKSSERMARSTRQLRQNNPRQASNQGEQALQRLEDAGRRLQRAQTRSLEQMVRNAVRRADQIATRQEQLARAVEELKKEKDRGYGGVKARVDALDNGRTALSEADRDRRVGQFVRRRLREIADAKDKTHRDLERLDDDLKFLAEQATREQPEANKALNEARREIRDKGLGKKIDRSKRLLREDALDRSLRTEKGLTQDLKRLADRIRTAQDNLVVPDRQQLARMQQQLRDAMSGLQDLGRQLNRLQRGGRQPGQQPGIGRQRALSQAYQQQLQNMRNIMNQLPRNSRQAQRLQRQLANAVALGNEPWKFDHADWEELRRGLAGALTEMNSGIDAQLQALLRKEKLYLARDEDVPPQYRDMVDQYYERLSKREQE